MMRDATVDDLELLVRGNAEMAKETEGLELDPDTLRAGVRAVLEGTQPGRYVVLEEQGRVVAQLMLTYEWSDWRNRTVWWIQSVYVPPESRGLGAYKRLYLAVLAEAEAAGAGGLRLYVDGRNERAQKVYAALGMDGAHYRVFERMFA